MLAQAFKSAKKLNISNKEYEALIKVMRMMERGELKLINDHFLDAVENGFCINFATFNCGTPSCIGGWVSNLMGNNAKSQMIDYVSTYQEKRMIDYVSTYQEKKTALRELYWGNFESSTTPEQAAMAIRNFLNGGDPKWEEVLS